MTTPPKGKEHWQPAHQNLPTGQAARAQEGSEWQLAVALPLLVAASHRHVKALRAGNPLE